MTVDPEGIYRRIADRKAALSIDMIENSVEDAKQVYLHARNDLKEALGKTEQGSEVYRILNQALSDMPEDPQNLKEMVDGYQKAIHDLGPLS